MPTKRSISINIPNDSLLALKNGNYKLVIFRGSASSVNDIKSTVLMTIEPVDLQEQNVINWEEQFYGFISKSALTHKKQVNPMSIQAMEFGDELHVNSDGTTATLKTPSQPTASNSLTFINDGDSTVCGYSMTHPSKNKPASICAANISGRAKANLMPLNRFMLMFTSDSAFDESMFISYIETNAAIVDYEQDTASRHVSYDFSTGYWSQGVDKDAMYRSTNGWLSNIWDETKDDGQIALNDILNKTHS